MTHTFVNALSETFSKFKNVDLKCSCTNCESPFCSAKRLDVAGCCSCEDCRQSKTCLFYNNRIVGIKSSRSDTTTSPRVSPFVASYIAPFVAPYVAPYLAPYIAPYVRQAATGDFTKKFTTEASTNTVELCKKLVGTPKYTIEELKKRYLYKSKGPISSNSRSYPYNLNPDEILPRKSVPTRHTLEVYETVSGNQRIVTELLKDVYLKGYKKSGYSHERKSAASRHALEVYTTVSGTQKSIIESLKSVYLKGCNNTGYNYDDILPRKSVPTRHTLKVYETVLDEQRTIIESLKNVYLKSCNKSGFSHERKGVPSRHTLEVYETVSDTQKTVIESLKNVYLKSCKKSGYGHEKPSRHALEVYETVSGTQRSIVDSLKNVYLIGSKKSHERTGAPIRHILDVYQQVSDAQRTLIESLKDVYLKGSKNSDCCHDVCSSCMAETSGYVIDLRDMQAKDTGQASFTHILDNKWNTIEQPNNPYAKKYICPCKETLKSPNFDHPGHITEVPKPVNVNNKAQTKYPHEKGCRCNESTNSNRSPPQSANSFGANKNKQHLYHVDVLKHNYQTNNKECMQHKSVPRCIYDVPKYNDNQTLNKGKSCEYETLKSKHFSSPYKPTKNAQELLKDIVEIHEDATLSNNCHKKSCHYSDSKQSKPPGYVLDLYSSLRNVQKKHCNDSTRTTSNTGDYTFDVPKYKKKCVCSEPGKHKLEHPIKNTQIFSINRFEASDIHKNIGSNITCECPEPNQIVQEVPEPEPTNNVQELSKDVTNKCQESSCTCAESEYKLKGPGLVYDLPKIPHAPKSQQGCKCSESTKIKSESHGYVYEVPKSKPTESALNALPNKCQKSSCTCKESEYKLKGPGLVYDVPKHPHAPTSQQGCKCSESTKMKSESHGYVFEVPKYKPTKVAQDICKNILGTQVNAIESLSNKCQKMSCSCKESEYKLNGPGFVYDVPKNPYGPTSFQICECCKLAKAQSELHGNVYEAPNYKPTKVAQEIFDNILETRGSPCICRESSKNKFDATQICNNRLGTQHNVHKKSCNCNDSSKLESSGYIYDVPKSEKQPCVCSPAGKSYSESRGDKPIKAAQDIVKNVLGKQANANPMAFNICQKSYCSCRESDYKLKGPGFIYDVQKCQHGATSAKLKPELRRYVFELPKHMKQSSGDKTCACRESKNKIDTTQLYNTHMNKKSCSCNDSSKHKSETPAYTYEVPKYDSKLEKNPCACNPAIKEHSEHLGYINDMSKHKPKNVLSTQANATGSLPNKCHKDSCSCNESEYKLKGPGFVYDLPKHSDGPASGRSCQCSESAKITPETHGYVYEVPKQVKQKACPCKESSSAHNTTTREQSNTTQIYSINRLETQFTVSDILHNIKKKSCNCTKSSTLKSELSTNTFEVPKYSSKSKKKNCQCSPICKRKSFSHEYINEFSKYKPTKTAQEIFKNILGTQADAIGSLPNKYRRNNCKKSEHELKGPGFVYDVPKYPRMPILQQTYKCSDSAKTKSESHGYIYMKQPSGDNQKRCACSGSPITKFQSSGYKEYQKYNMTPRELSNTTQIFSVNNLETQYTDPKRNLNNGCDCSNSDKRNSELSGYVYEVPKNEYSKSDNNNSHCERNENEPDDNTIATLSNSCQKNSCKCEKCEYKLKGYPDAPTTRKSSDCADSAKNKSESPGHIYEVPQSTKTISQEKSYEYQKKICECKESTKSKPDPLAYELTYLKSKLCSEDVLKLINKQKRTTESLSNQYNNSTNDSLSSKDKSLSSCNDSCRYKSNNNAQELFKDILEIHKNAIETLSHKYHKKNCDCNACKNKELESFGFVYEVPKLPHNSTAQRKNCECIDSSKRKSDSPGYIVDVSKYKPRESCESSAKNKFETTNSTNTESKITSTPSESQNNCKQMPCTQSDNIEVVKSINLPPEDKELSKDKLELNNCVSQNVPSNVPPIQTHNDDPQSNTGKAMLSAQVMDVPYTEFNASVACDKSETSKKLKKLSKYDIFKRIKEAYKACSCKVCECIAGKPVKPDICKCKPCECTDCLSYLEKSYFKPSSSDRSSFESSKCPCDGCNKNQCPSVMNKLEICDCSPCSCVECAKNFTKFCDCEPCECVDCKAKKMRLRQTLVVAPVGREQNVQRIACTCSPCDCIECGIVHRLASNVMHEMSTGTNRHALCRCEICLDEACDQSGIDSCKCQKRNKVMNKPVEKDTHDFDIRIATIMQKPITQWNNRKGEKHDTIAMFAAVPNTYPDSQSNTQSCTCKEECECISCICKEHAINSIKSSQFFTSIETRPKFDLVAHNETKPSTTENLRFSSYQCQVCKTQVEDKSSFNVLMPAMSKCVCEYCDSKDCRKNGSKSPQRLLNVAYNHIDYKQSMSKNNAKVLHENNLQNNEVSESVLSGYSSIETTSKTSCHKEYGMITQNSRNKNKSWESSCNSSGHDYPEYLIQFPKSTVENCLKDVMELDIDKNLKLNKLNINSNVTEGQIDLMSCDTTLAKENCLTDSYNPEHISRQINNHDVSQPDHRSCCFPDVSQHTLQTSAKCSYTLDPNRHLVLEVNNRQHSHKPKKYECQENYFMETKEINEVSGYIPDRRSPVNVNDKNRTISNPMHNENEFHTSHKVFDNNIAEKNKTDTLLPIHNDNDCTGKYLKQLPHVAHGLSLDDYDRIRKTLKEAKEFTRELIRLLKIYEKANNDFESVSEKLKISYASLISGDKNAICGVKEEVVDECIVKEERYNEINHELQEHLQAPSVRKTSSSITHVKRNISDTVEYSDHDNDKMSQKTILKDISSFQKMNESIIALDPSHDFNSVLETNELEQIETHLNKDEVCCESAVNEKMIEEHLGLVRHVQKTGINLLEKGQFRALEENTTTVNSRGIRKKDRTHVKNYKKYSKLLKNVLLISRKICVMNSNAIAFRPVTKYHVTVGTSTTLVSESNKKTNNETSTFLPIKFAVEDSQELLTLRRQGNELNQILKRLGTVFRNFEKDAESLGKTSVLERGLEEYNLKDTSNPPELEETDTWSILKKNSSWNIKPRKNSKDLCIIPSMELDLKKMAHSISQQKVVSKKRLNVPHHRNKDLEPIYYTTSCAKVNLIEKHKNLEIEEASMPGISLQSFCSSNQFKNVDKEVCCSTTNMDIALQIRDLLNLAVEMMPLKNKRAMNDNTSTATLVSSMASDKNNCDTLKVGFTALRRVSDDTVFVKWNVPRDLYKVKGYELLVDGRSVKTILTPTKSMALVTCLPPADRVLLTIRTITSDVSVTGHYPATTIIYNPRVK